MSRGDLPISIVWSFHGATVSPNMGVSTTRLGSRMSVLMIDSVSASHKGNYTCSAKNPAGTANYTATLSVNGMKH